MAVASVEMNGWDRDGLYAVAMEVLSVMLLISVCVHRLAFAQHPDKHSIPISYVGICSI
jgi:hypothetical protein